LPSLIEQLPKIVAEGRKEAEKILERLSSPNKITLQTNELVLPSKERSGLYFGNIPSLGGSAVETLGERQLEIKGVETKGQQKLKSEIGGQWMNRLIYGDNSLVMQALLSGDAATGMPSMRNKIDLIYIDPPFDSKSDYRTKIILPGDTIEQKPTAIEQFAYSDAWKEGTASYLKMLYPRLVLMKELLSDKGSILVQIDWHVGHYVKVILDDVFGKNNFINEIIWKRTFSHGDVGQGAKHLGRLHDTILYYSKTDRSILNLLYTPYSEKYIKDFYKYKDEDGRIYRLVTMTGPGGASKGNPRYEIMGVTRYWMYSKERMQELIANGEVVQTKPGNVPQRKKYLDEAKGVPLQDLWMDIAPIQGQAKENLNYDTQKPLRLIERIVGLASNEGSIVADFFSGSGTLAEAAEKLKRNWIISELGKPGVMIARKRLIDYDSKPFLYQSIGDYQKESFLQSKLYRRIGDLAEVVLNLYGAIPFPDENNPGRNLGYLKGTKTLVMVDSPSKLTGYPTLKRAQELRESFLGGWNKVIVLGWNFVFDIGNQIQSLNDEKVEVLVIPPDLLDKLKTKSGYEKLVKSGDIRFSSLQYLSIKIPEITEVSTKGGKFDEIVVNLDNYVLLSPDALPLDDKNKEKVQKIISDDPLALIEYWSVDPDFDGEVFRSKWQDYRGNVKNGIPDELRVTKEARFLTPQVSHKRKICVKAVDVFAFESVVVWEDK